MAAKLRARASPNLGNRCVDRSYNRGHRHSALNFTMSPLNRTSDRRGEISASSLHIQKIKFTSRKPIYILRALKSSVRERCVRNPFNIINIIWKLMGNILNKHRSKNKHDLHLRENIDSVHAYINVIY